MTVTVSDVNIKGIHYRFFLTEKNQKQQHIGQLICLEAGEICKSRKKKGLISKSDQGRKW